MIEDQSIQNLHGLNLNTDDSMKTLPKDSRVSSKVIIKKDEPMIEDSVMLDNPINEDSEHMLEMTDVNVKDVSNQKASLSP